jgi:radical SAM protein with 4Fe4S-binding SPASM domain
MSKPNPWRAIYDSPECRDPWTHPPQFPIYIDVELTNRCNLSCVMCARQKMTRPQGDMPLALLQDICRQAVRRNALGIRFIRWGEPLLFHNLANAISIVKGHGLLTHATTNGVLLADRFAQLSQLDSLIVSLQGLSVGEYTSLRGNHFWGVADGIDHLMTLKDRPHVHVSTTITDETEEQQAEFRDRWEKRVDSVGIGYTTFGRVRGAEAVAPFLERAQPLTTRFRCKEIRTKLSVNWNGDVTACCTDYNGEMILGNVSDGLLSLWRSPLRRAMCEITDRKRQDLLTLCATCELNYPFRGEE